LRHMSLLTELGIVLISLFYKYNVPTGLRSKSGRGAPLPDRKFIYLNVYYLSRELTASQVRKGCLRPLF
jgi:hypothetical protein